LVTLAAIVIVLAVVVHRAGGGDLLHRDGLGRFRQWVETLGVLGPPAFIVCYVVTAVAFVPALPMSVLGGLLFGPLWGTVYASIGSTLGACAAFLLARYAARDLVERWVAASPTLERLDVAAARHSFRLVMITRLVPFVPCNVQNYVYGVTGIRFVPYLLTSWLCMLPSTVAFTIAGGALTEGGWDARRMLPWFGLAAALAILASLLPRWLRGARRSTRCSLNRAPLSVIVPVLDDAEGSIACCPICGSSAPCGSSWWTAAAGSYRAVARGLTAYL
jgi:uncharacterized membrane protein YdjX (TVP38/TMEM64 family)